MKEIMCSYCKTAIIGDSIVQDGFIYHPQCHERLVMSREGYNYVCPKCDGNKKIRIERQNYMIVPDGNGDYGTDREYYNEWRDIKCPFCSGVGYLKEEPVVKRKEYKQIETIVTHPTNPNLNYTSNEIEEIMGYAIYRPVSRKAMGR